MKNTGKGKEPSFKQATSNTTSCIKLVAEDLNSFVQGNHSLSGSRSYGGFEPHCGSYDSLHSSYPQLEQTTTLITEAALIRVSWRAGLCILTFLKMVFSAAIRFPYLFFVKQATDQMQKYSWLKLQA